MLTQQFPFVTRIRFTCVLFYFILLMSFFMSSRWNLTFESGAYLEIVLTQMNTGSYRFRGMIERVHIKSSLKCQQYFIYNLKA